MKKYNFAADFPRMTDHFKNRVEREVHHQIQQGPAKAAQYKRPAKRVVIVICAVAILSGATAFAASELKLFPFLDKSNQDAPALVQTEVGAEQGANAVQPDLPGGPLLQMEDKSAVLTIEETLFDGTMLHIYATETGNGSKYALGVDGIIANGENVAADIFEKKGNGYYIAANLSGLSLPDRFPVTLPVSVYEKRDYSVASPAGEPIPEIQRYENQEFSFTVSKNETLDNVTRTAAAQKVEDGGFYVDVKEISLTPTATSIKYDITFTGSDAEEKAEEYGDFLISAAVGSETLYGGDNADIIQDYNGALQKTEDGYMVKGVDWTLKAFHTDGGEITITPYLHDGADRVMRTEYRFTVPF